MSNQKIALNLRFAIWLAHGERCWFCRDPLTFSTTHVDHVIPEQLLGTTELAGYLHEMGLPKSFDILSNENLAPAHSHCNQFKGADKFEATPLIQKIIKENISTKTSRAEDIRKELLSEKKMARSAATVLTAIEAGELDQDLREEIQDALNVFHKFSAPYRSKEFAAQPMHLAPWLEAISETQFSLIFKGKTGMIGARPKGQYLHPSWDCPTCGPTAWNGARCVICGELNDD